jgi:hypothetical protein
MIKPIVIVAELAQKPPWVLTLALFCIDDFMNGAPNLINKLKFNQKPNNFGTNVIPILVITPTMQPNSKEPTTIIANAMAMGGL